MRFQTWLMGLAYMIRGVSNFMEAYDRANDWCWRYIAAPVCDWTVDAWSWLKRATQRRFGRARARHRKSRGGDNVWMTLYGRPFGIRHQKGRLHADRRGWRYAPMMSKLAPVYGDEARAAELARYEQEMTALQVKWLIEDLNHMLANPPQPESDHCCENCLCGAVERWLAMQSEEVAA